MQIVFQASSRELPFAKIIELWTNSDYSHFDIVLPCGNLLGAYFLGGMRTVAFDASKYSRYLRIVVQTDNDTALNYAKSLSGRPYDFSALLKFFTPIKANMILAYMCSEAVHQIFYRTTNFTEIPKLYNSSRIAPRHMLDIFRSHERQKNSFVSFCENDSSVVSTTE